MARNMAQELKSTHHDDGTALKREQVDCGGASGAGLQTKKSEEISRALRGKTHLYGGKGRNGVERERASALY
jgi:hypothetical protein